MKAVDEREYFEEFGTFTEQMWRDIGKSALHKNEGTRPASKEVSEITGLYQTGNAKIVATHQMCDRGNWWSD